MKILLLQSNVIGKIQNLHKLKDLEYLNLALNNIQKVENLQRCEFLSKLDLTLNFIPKAGLLSLHSLTYNTNLQDLYLVGNPCADWDGYRQFVVATLPQVQKLDGTEIKPSERIASKQVLPKLTERLRKELVDEGVDPDEWLAVEIPPEYDEDELEAVDNMAVEKEGEKQRPWCAATRVLEARENEAEEREREEKKKSESEKLFDKPQPKRREKLDEIKEGEKILNKNEGRWDFTLLDSDDDTKIILDVAVGKFLDTSLIEADVQPRFVRLLIKGKLLQLTLSEEVSPDRSVAQRNKHTGHLVVTMPKCSVKQPLSASPAFAKEYYNEAEARRGVSSEKSRGGVVSIKGIVSSPKQEQDFLLKERTEDNDSSDDEDEDGDEDDDDEIPPLE